MGALTCGEGGQPGVSVGEERSGWGGRGCQLRGARVELASHLDDDDALARGLRLGEEPPAAVDVGAGEAANQRDLGESRLVDERCQRDAHGSADANLHTQEGRQQEGGHPVERVQQADLHA